MACGTEYFTAIVARSKIPYSDLMILDVDDNMVDVFDGCWCSDNGFRNMDVIPNIPGVWKVYCKLYWDDGKMPMSESIDQEFDVTILNTVVMSLDEIMSFIHY